MLKYVSPTFVFALYILAAFQAYAEPASDAAAAEDHPFVFSTVADYRSILKSDNPIIKSAIASLESQALAYLPSSERYTKTYGGCEINTYLRMLTITQRGEAAGAAHVASVLATYAMLGHMGFGDPNKAQAAAEAAKQILLSWAHDGFKENGRFRSDLRSYCEDGVANPRAWNDTGLQIARGMAKWANAQDLLTGLGMFSVTDTKDLDIFTSQIYNLMQQATNFRASVDTTPCSTYANHVSAHLLGLASIARLRHRDDQLRALFNGGRGAIAISWTRQVDEAIYGYDDTPRRCYDRTKVVQGYAETYTVAPGEIVDRYRSGQKQTFGYTLGSLTQLMLSGSLMDHIGLNALKHVGKKGQSLSLALEYYSYYLKEYVTTTESVVPEGPASYPDFQQYEGKQISGQNRTTTSGADGFLDPYILCIVLYPGTASCSAVIKRAVDLSAPGPALNNIDPIYLPMLARVLR